MIPVVCFFLFFLAACAVLQAANPLVCNKHRQVTDLEEFVYFAEVDSLLGIQLVNVADIPIHEIQAKPHHLEKMERQGFISLKSVAQVKDTSPSLSMRKEHFRFLLPPDPHEEMFKMCLYVPGCTW